MRIPDLDLLPLLNSSNNNRVGKKKRNSTDAFPRTKTSGLDSINVNLDLDLIVVDSMND